MAMLLVGKISLHSELSILLRVGFHRDVTIGISVV